MAEHAPITPVNEQHAADHHAGHHIVPVKTYLIVFSLLMVLLVITLGAAAIDFAKMNPALASLNIIIAMTIAIIKAVLIVLFFMHVKYSSRTTWLFAGAGFAWLMILFAFAFSDYMSRGWLPQPTH